VGDVFLVVARPRNIFLASCERGADRVHGAHPLAARNDAVECLLAHAGHDAHVEYGVGGIGDFNAELRDRSADRAHRERHDVHCAAAHRSVEERHELGLHLVGGDPVVRRARVLLLFGADEGAVLDARDITGV